MRSAADWPHRLMCVAIWTVAETGAVGILQVSEKEDLYHASLTARGLDATGRTSKVSVSVIRVPEVDNGVKGTLGKLPKDDAELMMHTDTRTSHLQTGSAWRRSGR